jgi:flagella synthesis protein FlgN
MEHQAAAQLLKLLQQEQAQLIQNDIDRLMALTEEKASIVARMTTLANGRHRALGDAGFEPRESGMQAWLKSAPATKAISEAWAGLLTLAQSAKEINHNNGILINRHLSRNRNALNVLQGPPQGGNLYGPNGQSMSRTSTRGVVVG